MENDHNCVFCGNIFYQTRDKKNKKVNKTPLGQAAIKNIIQTSKKKNDDKWRLWEEEDSFYFHDSKFINIILHYHMVITPEIKTFC